MPRSGRHGAEEGTSPSDDLNLPRRAFLVLDGLRCDSLQDCRLMNVMPTLREQKVCMGRILTEPGPVVPLDALDLLVDDLSVADTSSLQVVPERRLNLLPGRPSALNSQRRFQARSSSKGCTANGPALPVNVPEILSRQPTSVSTVDLT